MGLFDRMLGRTAPPPADLDALFAVPDAAITMESALGYKPTGMGSVCFRAPEGQTFADLEAEVQALLDADEGPKVVRSEDSYGYTWLTCRHDASDVAGLVTDLHAINSTLQDRGFGPALLSSLIGFTGGGASLGLVYLFKRGTFYPFAPRVGQRRDTALELQVRGVLGNDLRVEPDLKRWFAVWGAPGF